MTAFESVIAFIITAIVVITPLCVIFQGSIADLKESRKKGKLEIEMKRRYGERLMCTYCTYCKTKIYKPFYHSMLGDHEFPVYCRKYRIQLPNDMMTLCQSSDPETAERKSTTNHYKKNNMR